MNRHTLSLLLLLGVVIRLTREPAMPPRIEHNHAGEERPKRSLLSACPRTGRYQPYHRALRRADGVIFCLHCERWYGEGLFPASLAEI